MSRSQCLARGAYGAYELKATYQRNMLTGTLTAAMLTVVGVILLYLFGGETAAVPIDNDPGGIIVIEVKSYIPPPVGPSGPPTPRSALIERLSRLGSIPVPVADDALIDDGLMVYSRDELYALQPLTPDFGSGDGDNIVVAINTDRPEYPAIDSFVPVTTMPEMLFEAAPEYPRLAIQAGMDGVVWIKALVDTDGNVVRAVVFKPSGTNAGFDDAAVKAAYKCKYKPAVQNGYPVAVWVTYRVDFDLEDTY